MRGAENGINPPTETAEKIYYFRKHIVVIAGLPYAGKSTIGRELARCSNLVHLDVDEARWQIFPDHSLPPPDLEATAMILSYQRNHKLASDHLASGTPVVLTTTYSREAYHEMLLVLAKQTDVPLRFFLLTTPEDILTARIRETTARPHNSPSRIQTAEDIWAVRSRYVPFLNVTAVIDTNRQLQNVAEQILGGLADLRIS